MDELKLRRSLHERLEAAVGPDEAALLMDYLPPVGWADVARKEDLDHLAALTKRDLDAAMKDLKASLLIWMISMWIASMALAVTLDQITA